MRHIDHGEMLAIAEALDAAILLARSRKLDGTVRIFSDSKECLRLLDYGDIADIRHRHPHIDQDMMEIIRAVIWMSHKLRFLLPRDAAPLELNWIPGHGHNIYPHLVVDVVSRDVRCGTTKADQFNQDPNPNLRWKWEDIGFHASWTSDIELRCSETRPYWRNAPSRQ